MKCTDLSVFYTNKTTSLALEIQQHEYDIIVLTETHLDDSISDAEIFSYNYTVFRRDRKINGRFGGGVLIAVREPIKAYPRDTTNNVDSEILLIDVLVNKQRTITLGVFYRPPSSSDQPLLDLQTVLQNLSYSELILVGDFNLPDYDWSRECIAYDSAKHALLTNIMQDNFLTQHITQPTRNLNILDIVLTSTQDIINNLEVGEPFSDHNVITFNIIGKPYVRKTPSYLSYSFKKAEWTQLKSTLLRIPWDCAFFSNNIDIVWSAWKDLLMCAVDEFIPKTKPKRKPNAPWISKELILLCKKKKALYRKAKRTQDDRIWVKYRHLNNKIKHDCNTARWEFINKLSQDLMANENPKPFWSYIKSKRKGTNNLVTLKVGESVLNDDKSIASSMNSYFSSVFTVENFDNFPMLDCSTDSKLLNIHCSTSEVLKLLNGLNGNKSPGPDGISPKILKNCAAELAPSITKILNMSLSTGTLPLEWKMANITPLFKKGSKHCRENYRPISLTSIVCKICEKIVRSRILHFWNDLNLFNKNQFGFLEGRSTVTQLLSSFNDWASTRDQRIQTDIVFLDLAKAFDSVPHERLLLKLYANGIDDSLLDWFRQFLTGRIQRVNIRGTYSDWTPVSSGTPQGTVLGPILFLLFINDITDDITSTTKLYADDTKIYRAIVDETSDVPALQSDLNNLIRWANNWQLRFNADKCESMRITHSRDKSTTNYTLGSNQLKDVDHFKDLGVIITRDLSWGSHINSIVKKANQVLGVIKRSIGTANRDIFKMLYTSLVRPILEYAAPVWCPHLAKDLHALEKVQRRASRLALNQKKGEMPYEERCDILGWPTLAKRRKYLSLVECYKIVFGLNHLNFDDFFSYTNYKSTRANHNYKLYLKAAKVNSYKFSFSIRIVKDWNTLPSDIVHSRSLSEFKNKLQLYLGI